MHTWNLRLQEVHGLLAHAESHELSPAAVLRLRWFEFFLLHDQNISLTCRHFGIARSTLTRWLNCYRSGNPSSLESHSRRPHTVRTPQTDERTVELIRDLRKRFPKMGKEKIHEILTNEHGVHISVSTIGRVIARHSLFFAETESHRCKRGESTSDVTEDSTVHIGQGIAHPADASHASDGAPEDDDFPLSLPDLGLPLS